MQRHPSLRQAETHALVQLLQEKTILHEAGNMAIRAALELIQQRGYVITPLGSNCPLANPIPDLGQLPTFNQ